MYDFDDCANKGHTAKRIVNGGFIGKLKNSGFVVYAIDKNMDKILDDEETHIETQIEDDESDFASDDGYNLRDRSNAFVEEVGEAVDEENEDCVCDNPPSILCEGYRYR